MDTRTVATRDLQSLHLGIYGVVVGLLVGVQYDGVLGASLVAVFGPFLAMVHRRPRRRVR